MYSGDGNEHATAIIYIEEFRNAYDKYVRIQITMSCNLIGGIMDWDSVVPTGVIQLNQVIPEASESDNRVAKTIFERKLTFERQP